MNSSPIATPGRYSIYTGRTTSWPMVVATCAGAILLAVMSRGANGAWGDLSIPLVLIVIGILLDVLTSSSVRATAGPNGFTVRWGILGWPRSNYPLDEIAQADVIDLSWWRVSWGFWWTPKRTCSTVRSGPTVRLVLRNGRTITITVPDPEAAVAALRRG